MSNKRPVLVGVLMTLVFFGACTKDETKDNSFLYAFFKSDETKVSVADTVHFQDFSLGHPGKWEWTFEGASPAVSVEQNPSVIYDAPGTYAVSLTVTENGETSTKTMEKYITVVSAEQLDEDLLAYFPFNGSAEDAGPSHFQVADPGTVTFDGQDRHGQAGSSAVFDGSSLIVVPDQDAFNLGTRDFTISCWIKTTHTEKMMVWQESGAGGGGDNQTWLRLGDNTTDRLIRFDTEDGGGGNIINFGDGPSTAVSDGNWHNLVCVREGGVTRLYVDGEMAAEMIKGTPKDVSNSGDFKIGGQEGPAGEYHTFFTGMIDDLSIYTRAMNDEEVTALYLK